MSIKSIMSIGIGLLLIVGFAGALAACGDSAKPANPDGGDQCVMPTTVNDQLLNAPLDPAVFVVKKSPALPDAGIP